MHPVAKAKVRFAGFRVDDHVSSACPREGSYGRHFLIASVKAMSFWQFVVCSS